MGMLMKRYWAGFGSKERNPEGQMVVDFAKRMEMAAVNTCFQKVKNTVWNIRVVEGAHSGLYLVQTMQSERGWRLQGGDRRDRRQTAADGCM